MSEFIILTVTGIAFGAVYSLTAAGFLLIYKATGVLNFAQGELTTLGAYVAFALISEFDMPIIPAYLLSIVVLFGVGVLLERLAYAPLREHPTIVVVIATLGASLAIRGFIANWQGVRPKRLPSPVGISVWRFGDVVIPVQDVLIIIVSVIALVGLMLATSKTQFGRSIRALAEDREMAKLQGIRANRLSMLVFGMGASLSALAGVLIAPRMTLDLSLGFNLMLVSFATAVLCGFGRIGGVIIAGLLIGLTQMLVGEYLVPNLKELLPFLLIVVVVAVRPQGLFGGTSAARV